MAEHPLFELASNWEATDEEERRPLRQLVEQLVGYPCKLACRPNEESVDLYVFSIQEKKIADWIEIQPNGAMGVIFEMYKNKEPTDTNDRCEDYNASIEVVFQNESDSDSESDDN
jgi:hypothetical protein